MEELPASSCPRCGAAVSSRGAVCPGCALGEAASLDLNEGAALRLDDLCPASTDDPKILGKYRILKRIGEGGMGVVYRAEQQDDLRRIVALKVVRLGLNSREVIARFQIERQALTVMNHPHVAQVFDAGTAADGRPFFAMEFVEGVPITTFCDQQRLPLRQRLELFISVCKAVQHAHQKGVIHRDLKPTNILVAMHDGVPIPKIIDFGVAKATEDDAGRTAYTRMNQIIGTPAYMSPEQADLRSADIDTRTDIYSLGVLLYELLTGAPPFRPARLQNAGFEEMRRIIREEEPERPSARLKAVAAGDSTIAAHEVKGDIDWIVIKALEKDRARRYDTANGLATDLARCLDHEPVIARPPSAAYRLRKTLRRHRAIASAALLMLITLVAALVVSLREMRRATRAEHQALTALNELRATAPTFAAQARVLASQRQFADAIEKLDYALKLQPDAIEFLLAKASLLQVELKFTEAGEVFRRVLTLNPQNEPASANARLCDELAEAQRRGDGKLGHKELATLFAAIQKEKRSTAELLAVAQLIGAKQPFLADYWCERLRDLPISPDRPLTDRLIVREDRFLELDLERTAVGSLAPLRGMPLQKLNLSFCRNVNDLTPLTGLPIVRLYVDNTGITTVEPLRGMSSLAKLSLNGTTVFDLAPVPKSNLVWLALWGSYVRDLSTLRGCRLEYLDVRDTAVMDLDPLRGMPLKWLNLKGTQITNFTPLAGMPLEDLDLAETRVGDLAFLRGAPLKTLILSGCTNVRNLRVLLDIPTLDTVYLPANHRFLAPDDVQAIAMLKSHPGLKRIGVGKMEGWDPRNAPEKERFFSDHEFEQNLAAQLRSAGIEHFRLAPLGDKTFSLDLSGTSISNLNAIPSSAPISELKLKSTLVSDLTPVRTLPLKSLDLTASAVIDLSPLRGTSLRYLRLSRTSITNLEPLRGLPIVTLLADSNFRVDVSPLAELPALQSLVLPSRARNVEALRASKLEKLSFFFQSDGESPGQSARDFWTSWDATPWMQPLREAGINFSARVVTGGNWWIEVNEPGFADLSPLTGAPIVGLKLADTRVRDLAPLQGMKLTFLGIAKTDVSDLRPLQGMPLETLGAAATAISDLSPLRGMPLKTLLLGGCTNVTDLTPVAEIKTLHWILLPPKASGIEKLRTLPALKRISARWDTRLGAPAQTAAEFWEMLDSKSPR